MLTSRTLLKNGVAVDRVIKSLITNKNINPDSLLVGDRNAVLIAAEYQVMATPIPQQFRALVVLLHKSIRSI